MGIFGLNEKCYIWQNLHSIRSLISDVKGGESVISGCFAVSGSLWLAIIAGTINSALYQKVLQGHVKASVCELTQESQHH